MGAVSSSPENVADYISKLAGANTKEREQAAYALFRLGCAMAEPVLMKWFADPEFRALVPRGGVLLTVGLAVQTSTFEAIRARFGEPRLAQVPPDQDVLEFELSFAHGVQLDVLTPGTVAGEGAIAKFLARFGEGVQQVECDVRDVSRATEILRERFHLQPIYPEIRPGANQTRVNFFLVPVADDRKLLIELVEPPEKRKTEKDVKKSKKR
jgi:hypothetical protein